MIETNVVLNNLFCLIENQIKKAHFIDISSNIDSLHESQIQKYIREVCKEQPKEFQDRIFEEYFGVGPLKSLIENSQITEIIINSRHSIWYEEEGQFKELKDHFFSELTYNNFIHRLSRDSGAQVNLEHPFSDGSWRNYRIHMVGPPIVSKGIVICLRSHPLNSWTFNMLELNHWCTKKQKEILLQLINDRLNILIIGATGSGKTSVLNAFLNEIPKNERVIIIEDVDEISLSNTISTKLLTRKDLRGELREIDQSDLLKQSLRMRPDRIVMGEVRGSEAKDLLMALATGHSGSIGTLHAKNARQALIRLEMMIQMGAPQWNLQAIRTLIQMSLQIIIVVEKTACRKLKGIYRISSLEECGFLLEEI